MSQHHKQRKLKMRRITKGIRFKVYYEYQEKVKNIIEM